MQVLILYRTVFLKWCHHIPTKITEYLLIVTDSTTMFYTNSVSIIRELCDCTSKWHILSQDKKFHLMYWNGNLDAECVICMCSHNSELWIRNFIIYRRQHVCLAGWIVALSENVIALYYCSKYNQQNHSTLFSSRSNEKFQLISHVHFFIVCVIFKRKLNFRWCSCKVIKHLSQISLVFIESNIQWYSCTSVERPIKSGHCG